MKNKLSTICFLLKEDKVLLGMKQRGFGAGKWNGFGGKPEPEKEETMEDVAKREILEEAKLSVNQANLEKVAIIDFFEDNDLVFRSHVFLIRKWTGTPQETEEMKPRWFHLSEIPYQDMWSADKEWIPLALSGKKFKATIHFEPGMDAVKSFKYREVSDL